MSREKHLVFSPFTVDTMNNCLWRNSQRIILHAKSLALLAYLAEHPGQLITKRALMRAVWDRTNVVEAVVKVNIAAIRKALGDNADKPKFIETVGRQGYRFIAPVRQTITTGDSLQGVGSLQRPRLSTRHQAVPRRLNGQRMLWGYYKEDFEGLIPNLAYFFGGVGVYNPVIGYLIKSAASAAQRHDYRAAIEYETKAVAILRSLNPTLTHRELAPQLENLLRVLFAFSRSNHRVKNKKALSKAEASSASFAAVSVLLRFLAAL